MPCRPRTAGKAAFCLDLLSVERRLARDSNLSGREEVEESSCDHRKIFAVDLSMCIHVGIGLMAFVEAFPVTLPELAATCLQYTQSLFLDVHIVDRMDESIFGEAPAGIQGPPCQRKLNHYLRFPSAIKSCRKANQSIHWTMHFVLMNDGMR